MGEEPSINHQKEGNGSRHFATGSGWLLPGLVVLIVGILLFFALRPGPPLSGPPGGGPSGPPMPPPGAPGPPEETKTAKGTVVGFRSNPHLDINALQIEVARAGVLTIDFRPHTARAIMELAGVKDSVEVDYTTHPNDEVIGYRLKRIRNQRTGKEVVLEDLPPPPDIPPNHPAEYFTLRGPQLITDSYGGIVAIRSEHLLFHFKPGLVDNILPLIKTAGVLGLSAVWRDDGFGFVNVYHDKVYVVLSVTIDNKTFLVR